LRATFAVLAADKAVPITNLVLSGRLCPVERHVSAVDEFFGVAGDFRIRSHTKTHRYRVAVSGIRDGVQ
jgi:hypothetical protein